MAEKAVCAGKKPLAQIQCDQENIPPPIADLNLKPKARSVLAAL